MLRRDGSRASFRDGPMVCDRDGDERANAHRHIPGAGTRACRSATCVPHATSPRPRRSSSSATCRRPSRTASRHVSKRSGQDWWIGTRPPPPRRTVELRETGDDRAPFHRSPATLIPKRRAASPERPATASRAGVGVTTHGQRTDDPSPTGHAAPGTAGPCNGEPRAACGVQ